MSETLSASPSSSLPPLYDSSAERMGHYTVMFIGIITVPVLLFLFVRLVSPAMMPNVVGALFPPMGMVTLLGATALCMVAACAAAVLEALVIPRDPATSLDGMFGGFGRFLDLINVITRRNVAVVVGSFAFIVSSLYGDVGWIAIAVVALGVLSAGVFMVQYAKLAPR